MKPEQTLSDSDIAYPDQIPAQFRLLGKVLKIPEQQSWLAWRETFISRYGRKPDQERWQLPPVSLPPGEKAQVMDILSRLGITSTWPPKHQFYDYVILPGATVPSMKQRLEWIASLWQNGLRFNNLVVLTGQRPLTDNIDHFQATMKLFEKSRSIDFTSNMPMHETEAAYLLLHYFPFPAGMENINVISVDTPRKWWDNQWHRSHTGDTVIEWMNRVPTPGSVLLVTNQPNAHYQESVFKRDMLPGFTLDTTAPAIDPQTPLQILLDAVSTWLRTVPVSENR